MERFVVSIERGDGFTYSFTQYVTIYAESKVSLEEEWFDFYYDDIDFSALETSIRECYAKNKKDPLRAKEVEIASKTGKSWKGIDLTASNFFYYSYKTKSLEFIPPKIQTLDEWFETHKMEE